MKLAWGSLTLGLAVGFWLLPVNPGESAQSGSGFKASIAGDVMGDVNGPGVLKYLAPSKSVAGQIPGRYFLADNQGLRELGVTLSIPESAKVGSYKLVSASPLDAGKFFEIRVDRSVGNNVLSYSNETKGELTLSSFPSKPNKVSGSKVKGSFKFKTQNNEGKSITVQGKFNFLAK